jgi:Fur family ferric uptake transcriptional regulator
MTKQREVILEELSKVTSHPTADEIYEMVRKKLPRISLGTIYRNLEILSECGLITKMEIGGVQKRFDAVTENHYHIRCIVCGRVDDVDGEVLVNIADRFNDLNGYEVVDHRLELMGICPSCRDKSRPQ